MDHITLRLSWLDAIQNLGDAERGRLLTALLEYAQTQEPKKLRGNERYVYDGIIREINAEVVQNAHDSVQVARCIDTNIPSEEGTKRTNRYRLLGMFEIFWKAYPVHVNRKRCVELWEKINPDEALLEKMLKSIAEWMDSRKWREGYINDPDTWLRNEKWNDEVPPDPQCRRKNKLDNLSRLYKETDK